MQAKVQLNFKGTIGTNDPTITEERLIEMLLEMEMTFNAKFLIGVPLKEIARLHIFHDSINDKTGETNEDSSKSS